MEEKMKKAECVCAACNTQFDVNDEMLFGEMVLCPYCHAEIQVPASNTCGHVLCSLGSSEEIGAKAENPSVGTPHPHWDIEKDLPRLVLDLALNLATDLEKVKMRITSLEEDNHRQTNTD
jgi:DNA-directed RNA polymerase subunit RPC12/RpoP